MDKWHTKDLLNTCCKVVINMYTRHAHTRSREAKGGESKYNGIVNQGPLARPIYAFSSLSSNNAHKFNQ